MNLRTFDVKAFNQYKQGSERIFTQSDGFNVRQTTHDGNYQEELTKPDTPYLYVYVYNSQGQLILKGVEFYRIKVSEWTYYNDRQQILKVVDYDKPYKITIKDLITLMQQKFDIDLLDTSRVFTISRFEDKNTNKPLYEIYTYNPTGLDGYLIEGNTGELLFKIDTSLKGKNKKRVYVEYIKSTPEYQQGIYRLEDEQGRPY